MKISKLFHYLYAAIMFLPLVVLPVFMIYSHRHVLTEQTEVDIQYKYQTNEVNNPNDLIIGNLYHLNLEEGLFDNFIIYDETDMHLTMNFVNIENYNFGNYTFSLDETLGNSIQNGGNIVLTIEANYENTYFYVYPTYNTFNYYLFAIETSSLDSDNFSLIGDFVLSKVEYISFTSDLSDFITKSDYNEIESVDVQDINSSIMDVTFNSFNETINRYFNMRNVFNLNQLYNWLNVNVFNGVSAVSFNILFNLFAYWLFVSLLWLIFDVFMYIPLIMHNAIDKARLE